MNRHVQDRATHPTAGEWDYLLGLLFEMTPPEFQSSILKALEILVQRSDCLANASILAQHLCDGSIPESERSQLARLLS